MQEFKILKNQELGRYAVALKQLKAGEIFLEELPFAYGPKASSDIVCLECCIPTAVKCNACGWPLCADCASNLNVHNEECVIFTRTNTKFYNQIDQHGACMQLDCITPLRVLLAKDKDEERWKQEVDCMEDHEFERKHKSTWAVDENNIVQYLRKQMKLVKYSEELIRHVIGILEVNAFEGRSVSGCHIRILYPKLAILAHNCIPNTSHTIYSHNGYKMIARTTVDVEDGAQLYSTYTYTLFCTAKRQHHLKEGKFFTCQCKRCLDPTELNTHLSTLKCPECDSGILLTICPLNFDAEWKCTDCEFNIPGKTVRNTINSMQNEMQKFLQIVSPTERIESLESLLKKYASIVHPQHYVMMTLRQNLIELYGKAPGYQISNLSDALLQRKIELCESVLTTLNVIEPGLTRSRGEILYELHATKFMFIQSLSQQGILQGSALKKKLEEVLSILKMSYNILCLEDPKSLEGNLAVTAKNDIEKLKQSISKLIE